MESGLVSTTARDAARAPPIERLGRYFLLERIATGGMAEVYRAVIRGVEGFRRTFIVKRILSQKASSPDFIRMFCNEARISALLNHPNIAQVYDFGCASGCYFLAMEYLPGKDLSSLLRVLRKGRAAMPPGLAAYVTREAALGLHYAHTLLDAHGEALGIVHRDVTPSNIMLLFAGGVKLLDFGIAKTAAAAAGEAEGIKGKFGYLAPEQARNEDVDGRADVFGLGVTLWEMLVGERLFAGKDDSETLRNVLEKPIAAPSSLRPEVPTALDLIVLRALEREKEKRYATADELAHDCDAVLETLRADGVTLRAFLNERFIKESSALALAPTELPEGVAAAPSDPALPRADPPIDITFREDAPHRGWRRLPLVGGALLAAGGLIALGLSRDGRRSPAAPTSVQSEPTRAIIVALPPNEPVGETPPPRADGEPTEVPRASGEKPKRRKRGHHSGARELPFPAALTLNPF
jgi:serine/threonine-protein kinase